LRQTVEFETNQLNLWTYRSLTVLPKKDIM